MIHSIVNPEMSCFAANDHYRLSDRIRWIEIIHSNIIRIAIGIQEDVCEPYRLIQWENYSHS